jgi:arylsulfatase A-like enzyme
MNVKLSKLFSGAFFIPSLVFSAHAEKPNMVVFLVDDFGWKDLSCYGSKYYETPAVDRLAASGVRFTNAYSSCTVSSPTRASLMTGKYPARLHLTDWIPGYKYPNARLNTPDWTMFLPREEVILAELLKEEGYRTASIGKWHLGEDSTYWPENQGFDLNVGGYSKGQPNSYFSPYNNPRMTDGPKGEYITDRLTEESVGFIRKNQDRPFFLYLPHYAVHSPFQAKKEMIDKYRAKTDPDNNKPNPVYAAMVESMDQSMGKIVEEIERLKLSSKTYIFFLSDNGGLCPQATTNYPLREGKGTAYEGGTRTPLIISGPGIPKGEVINYPVITMDVFSTILELAGISKKGISIDGKSLLPAINGGKNLSDRPLFWHYPHYHSQGATPYSAVRLKNWKYYYFYEDNHAELYDLGKDVSEKQDLSGQNPRKMKELNGLLNNWLREVGAQLPVPNTNYDPQKQNKKR